MNFNTSNLNLNLNLNTIVVEETKVLEKLLGLLEEQHDLLIKNDVIQLQEIVESIRLCNKEVAEKEVARRNILAGASMKETVEASGEEELDTNYRRIKKLLSEIKVQKDCNEMLIKMGIGFSTKMLGIMKPDSASKTYNNYGKVKR